MLNAVIVFPQPDSPTRHTLWAFSTQKETPLTGRKGRFGFFILTVRLETLRMGLFPFSFTVFYEKGCRIEKYVVCIIILLSLHNHDADPSLGSFKADKHLEEV